MERLNQELTRFLRSYCHRNQADWSRFLLWAEYAQELPLQARHRPHPFQMRAGFPTSLIPMVRGTLRITGCRFMTPAERGDLE